jgi:hypothetical protein
LHQAIFLLLDWDYGEARARKLTSAIETTPGRKRVFFGKIEPINELLYVRAQSVSAYDAIMTKVAAKRSLLREKFVSRNKELVKRRTATMEYMRGYRERLRNTVRIEELRVGRKLTKAEADQLVASKKKIWSMQMEAFCAARPKTQTLQAARSEFCGKLNAKVKEMLDRADVNRGVKQRTGYAPASPDKLDRLQRKFK